MKEFATTNIITTILGILLFLFAMLAVWYGKVTVLESLMVIPASLACIVIKNKKLIDLIYKLLRVKQEDA